VGFAAWAGFGQAQAQAQQYAGCNDYALHASNEECPNRQAAYSAAKAIAEFMNINPVNYPTVCTHLPWSSGRFNYQCTYRSEFGSQSVFRHYRGANECPAGTVWHEAEKKCGADCANAPPVHNKAVRGSFSFCQGGCQYMQDGIVSVCLGQGADMYCGGADWKATGQSCQAHDSSETFDFDPNKETCRSTGGGWNECVKPSGEHCVTGAKGTR